MSSPNSTPRVRVDAQRNRERLLDAARVALATGSPNVSLEGIARDAGVGIGTLYRHFPTREDLIEAVYRTELDGVIATATDLLAELDPPAALRAWMDAYAEFVLKKRGMAESLRGLHKSGAIRGSQTRERVVTTIQQFLDAGSAAHEFRADVRAEDIAASMVGVFLATPDPAQAEQAARMLDLLFAGIRR